MTRANSEQLKHTPWFAKAGAACSIVPISRFIGPNTFALKGGGYGCLFALNGIDEEGLTDHELDACVRSIEGALRGLLRRINDVLYNPANLGVPKHILIEEIFSSMKNKQLLDGALASIKTVRKNLGGVTMIGQSADDLGANADSIVNSCTSFLFLKDATFNRKKYAELFKMNEQQIALFESLQDREGLYMRRDGLTGFSSISGPA